jgi:hypothetical protein
MQTHKLRRSKAGAAAFGVAAMAATLVLGAGVASASVPSDPPGGAVPVPPHFYNGNVEGIRDSGSDTTFFMMQHIGDLYTGAGLYGCTLQTSGGALYNSLDSNSGSSNYYYCESGGNVSTTDVNDNWDRTEVTEGVDDVGSGAGQNQLCGVIDTPLPVDFARSSKPSTGACATEVETGYAKDAVPIIDYPLNPSTYGSTSPSGVYSSINGGDVGNVANGWLPGDPTSGPYNGTRLTDIDNNDNGGGADSTAYRLWCSTATSGAGARISDWGQLTNLGPNIEIVGVSTTSGSTTATITSGPLLTPGFPSQIASGQGVSGVNIPGSDTVSSVTTGSDTLTLTTAANGTGTTTLIFATGGSKLAVGQGVPDGIPVRIVGVNTASGTEATFTSYALSGQSGGGCGSNMNTNAASDPYSATDTGDNTGAHIALENNSDQLDQFAQTDFPSDYVDQAVEVATSLYIESNGVYNTNPYAAASTIDGTSYSGNKLNEDGESPSTSNDLNNIYPTARTLFNIYNSATIRASTGGFLNWICDGDVNFQKQTDNSTGKNFDTELTTTISTTYGFPRLTDESTPPLASNGTTPNPTPLDNLAAPNDTCAAALPVVTTAGSATITLQSAGNFPVDIHSAGSLGGGYANVTVAGGGGLPAVTSPQSTPLAYVVSGGGTSTITLSQDATTSGDATLVFYGVPSVVAVDQPQT